MRILPSIWLAALLVLQGSLYGGTPLFPNGDFSDGMKGWNLLCLEKTPAVAEVRAIENGKHAVCVTVPVAGAQGYYVQFVQRNIVITGDKSYKLSFRARSKIAATITLNLWPTEGSNPHALWRVDQVAVTDAWKDYSYDIDPKGESGNFNLDFGGLAKQAGEYWLTDIGLDEVEK